MIISLELMISKATQKTLNVAWFLETLVQLASSPHFHGKGKSSGRFFHNLLSDVPERKCMMYFYPFPANAVVTGAWELSWSPPLS